MIERATVFCPAMDISKGGSALKNGTRQMMGQVRFSLPSGLESEVSPSKIVFPNQDSRVTSGAISNHGHIVDMNSKIMVDVPEEIWNFHNARRQHTRSTSCGSSGHREPVRHKKSASLQSALASTLDAMNRNDRSQDNSFNSNSSTSNVSPLNLPNLSVTPRLTPKKPTLFLTPDSPLNKYKVPIPLEIQLPPYLSPKNRQRQTNNLVYDGSGYSVFTGEGETDTSDSSQDISTVSDSSLDSIISSIPSAEHDISFNPTRASDDETNPTGDNFINETLGLDDDGNVNLKVQIRNLRKQRIRDQQSVEKTALMPTNNDSSSLNILSTPSKQILIPDVNNVNYPPSANGTLKFFDEPEPETYVQSHNLNRGTLNPQYTFPPNQNVQLPHEKGFDKIDNSNLSPDFIRRRERLMQNQLSPNKANGHAHRRSRSIHQVDDIFNATSTPPQQAKSVAAVPEIPKRSPMRLKGHSVYATDENVTKERIISFADETSSLYGSNDSIISCFIPGNTDDGKELPNDNDILNRADESLVILSERILSDKPGSPSMKALEKESISSQNNNIELLSSMQSFKYPIGIDKVTHLSTVTIHPIDAMEEIPNRLSSSRVLSNTDSTSSVNSEFSKPSYQTSTTSYQNSNDKQEILQYTGKNFKSLAESSAKEAKDNSDFKSILEQINGRLQEVIIIEDEGSLVLQDNTKTTASKHRKTKSLPANLSKTAELMLLCEETAQRAKSIIFQLLKEKQEQPAPSDRRPLPPSISSNSKLTNNKINCIQSPKKYLPKDRDVRVHNRQARYLQNFNRSIKAHSRTKSMYA